jgi:hypothetical protein
MDEGGYAFPAMNGEPMRDMERAETFKKAQRALVGRHATGGLVDHVARDPGAPDLASRLPRYAARPRNRPLSPVRDG